MITNEAIEAAALSDAAFDGRRFDGLSAADKRRYQERSAAALTAALERGRIEERERIVELLWAEHAAEHAKLGVLLADKRESEIGMNWQGGKVNGLATAIQITKEPTP